MDDSQLIAYIRQQLTGGVSKEILKRNIVATHMASETDVEKAFAEVAKDPPVIPADPTPMPGSTRSHLERRPVSSAPPTPSTSPTHSGGHKNTIFATIAILGFFSIPVMYTIVVTTLPDLELTGPAPTPTQEQQPEAHIDAGINQIQLMLELYYDENGYYPDSLTDLRTIPDLPPIPTDPENGDMYDYTPTQDGSSYELCAHESLCVEPM